MVSFWVACLCLFGWLGGRCAMSDSWCFFMSCCMSRLVLVFLIFCVFGCGCGLS